MRLQAMLVSTFSLDLVALVAVLGGICVPPIDSEGNDPAQEIRAICGLIPRLMIICQTGRVKPPVNATYARRLALLDRCVHEIGLDEREACWHAKFILAVHKGADGELWQLWIGSRNLSQSTDLDYGLMLEGRHRQLGIQHPTVPGLTTSLRCLLKGHSEPLAALFGNIIPATRVTRPFLDRLMTCVDALVWSPPKGTEVEMVAACLNSQYSGPIWKLPPGFSEFSSVLAVSPFVNRGGLLNAHLKPWLTNGKTVGIATLISTQRSLDNLDASICKDLQRRVAWYAPNQQAFGEVPRPDDDVQPSSADLVDDDVAGRGLHAKILLARHKRKRAELLFGSANFTARALGGSNAEVMVRLSVTATVANRLADELKTATTEYHQEEPLDQAKAEAEIALEHARASLVAELNPILDFRPPIAILTFQNPAVIAPGCVLKAAPLTRSDLLLEWAPPHSKLTFQPINEGDFSEWVAFEVSSPAVPEIRPIAWLQKAELTEPAKLSDLQNRRDTVTMAALGLDGLCDIIAAELGGFPLAGGRGRKRGRRKPEDDAREPELNLETAFRIEDVLRSRARRPEAWQPELLRKIRSALEELERQTDPLSRKHISHFKSVWSAFADAFAETP
jgi:hypothetical protein